MKYSRLSTGSTKSEMLDREKKHGKGIIKKITTKLTKSASIDDPNISMDHSLQVNKQRYFCLIFLKKKTYRFNDLNKNFFITDIRIRDKYQ